MRGRLLVVAILGVGAAMAFAGCWQTKEWVPHTTTGPVPASSGVAITPVKAFLTPPLTTYEVTVTLPQNGGWVGGTVTWTNSERCGTFNYTQFEPPLTTASHDVTAKSTATWDHGDATNCSHDSLHHPGTIRFSAGNSGGGHYVLGTDYGCAYALGSDTGDGEPCTYSQTIWSEEDTPALEAPLVIGVLGLAASVCGRRSRRGS